MLLVAGAALVTCTHGPRVVVHAAQGPITIAVEIANSPTSRERGLMYRKDLAADAGMLFLFPQEELQEFWMKNTPLPLDMVFIDTARTIVGVVADTKPFSTQGRGVGKPSRYVLEVHAGFCAKHSIATGDTVDFVDVPDGAT